MSRSGGPSYRSDTAPHARVARRGEMDSQHMSHTPAAPPPASPPPADAVEVIIIAFNERLNLPHCLRALVGWVKRVYVIDSGSTDGTRELAREMGAEVVEHDWEGYAAQKNWALTELPLTAPWVLLVDADEVITPALKAQIEAVVQRPPEEVEENGFFINRLTYFLNRPIRHCGYFPSWNLRLFKRGAGAVREAGGPRARGAGGPGGLSPRADAAPRPPWAGALFRQAQPLLDARGAAALSRKSWRAHRPGAEPEGVNISARHPP